jgi:hypothetical protein
MPVFWFLVVLGIIALWFLLAFSYKGVGRFFKSILRDSVEAIVKDDPKDFTITYASECDDNNGGNE